MFQTLRKDPGIVCFCQSKSEVYIYVFVSVVSLSLSLKNVFILPGPKRSLEHEECSLQNSTPRFYHWEGIFFDRFQWETPFLIFFLQNTFKCVKQTNYKHTKYWIFDEVDSSDNQTSIHELKTDNFTPAFENGQSWQKQRNALHRWKWKNRVLQPIKLALFMPQLCCAKLSVF